MLEAMSKCIESQTRVTRTRQQKYVKIVIKSYLYYNIYLRDKLGFHFFFLYLVHVSF